MQTNCDRPADGLTSCSCDKITSKDGKGSMQGADEKDDKGNDIPVQLPYRFHDLGNLLMLCDVTQYR